MMRTERGHGALLDLEEEPAQGVDGRAQPPAAPLGEARRPSAGREPPLFPVLLVSNPYRRRRAVTLPLSLAVHAAVIAALALIPIFSSVPPPEHPDYIRALLYDPPPPPPPPLPKGSPRGQTPRAVKPAAPEPTPRPAPVEPPREAPKIPAPRIEAEAPREAKPQYPQDAFVKKIEGTVLVEILIDARGRVARAQVVRSVPALDAAALEAVRQWVFSPAIKQGQPVATVAVAPVTFRIY